MKEIRVVTEGVMFGKKYAYLFIPEEEDVKEWTLGMSLRLDTLQNEINDLQKIIEKLEEQNSKQATEIRQLRQNFEELSQQQENKIKELTQKQEKTIEKINSELGKEFAACKKELKERLDPLSRWAENCSKGQDKKIADHAEKIARLAEKNKGLEEKLTLISPDKERNQEQERKIADLYEKITRMEEKNTDLTVTIKKLSQQLQTKSPPGNVPGSSDSQEPPRKSLLKRLFSRHLPQ